MSNVSVYVFIELSGNLTQNTNTPNTSILQAVVTMKAIDENHYSTSD